MCSTSDNSEYEIPPSAPSKLPLVASSRRQLLIFAERYTPSKAEAATSCGGNEKSGFEDKIRNCYIMCRG